MAADGTWQTNSRNLISRHSIGHVGALSNMFYILVYIVSSTKVERVHIRRISTSSLQFPDLTITTTAALSLKQ